LHVLQTAGTIGYTKRSLKGWLVVDQGGTVLSDRPDAAHLLELLGFDPPDWRQYYEELWARFPILATDFINVDYWNFPKEGTVDQWEIDWDHRRRQDAAARSHQQSLMVAELRALAAAVTARRGTARKAAMKRLDRRLAEFGLRPSFPGGTRIPPADRPKARQRYAELRAVIDEVRSAAADGLGEDFHRAVFIRFPFFTEDEMSLIFSLPYLRRGATADAALEIMGRRLGIAPDSLHRYLFRK
jgi:hypothetical protein